MFRAYHQRKLKALCRPLITFVGICFEQRRALELHDTGRDRRVGNLYKVLGFSNWEDPKAIRSYSEETIREQFRQQCRQIQKGTCYSGKQSLDLRPFSSVLHEEERQGNTVLGSNVNKASSATVQHRLREVYEAYKILMNLRTRTVYSQFTDCSNEEVLQSRPTQDGALFPMDEKHQMFQFQGTTEKGFGDNRSMFEKKYLGGVRELHDQYAHQGLAVHMNLQLTFQEALEGCIKHICYEKEQGCQRCYGSGAVQQKCPKRCPQCRGEGSYELPSGTYLVRRECSVCVGKGEAPPPKCIQCQGLGTVRCEKKLLVEVPCGVEHKAEKRFPHLGNAGARGGSSGDLIVTYYVKRHPHFHRVENDIHVVVPLSLSTALIGGNIPVKTPRGVKQLSIPPLQSPDQIMTIFGEGVKTAKAVGHLKVHLVAVIPNGEFLSPKQKAAVRQLEDPTISMENYVQAKSRFKAWIPDTEER